MEKTPNPDLRLFIIWEPVLPTDWTPPTTGVLARVWDPRAAQFWDKQLLVSQKILEAARADASHELARCCDLGNLVWDVVAIYPKGARWDAGFPSPAFGGRTVVEALDGFNRRLALELAQ